MKQCLLNIMVLMRLFGFSCIYVVFKPTLVSMCLKLLSLTILLALSTFATASTVYLEPGVGRYNLGLYAEILEDKQGELTINQVKSSRYSDKWYKNQMITPNFAFSNSAYWLRITVTSQREQSENWWLEVAFPLQDFIDYYLVDNEHIVNKVSTGDRRVFNSRSFDYRNFLFDLEVPAGQSRQVYLRLDSNDGLHEPFPLILWDQQSFSFSNGIRNLGLGIYFGIMLVMALYNLFIYLSVKDTSYLYYVAYILGFSFWLFTYYGFSFQYFWPNKPHWGNQAIIVLTSFWAIFMVQFVRYFLDTKRLVPWFETVSRIYIAGMVFAIFASYSGNYSIGILTVIGVGAPACIGGIAAGISSWKAGYRPARYFLLAWTVLLIAIAIFCLKIAGLLPTSWVIERSIQIGSVIEVILLSLGLADRINILKKEKIQAQDEAIGAFESSLKLKNDFITSISHELRTPMNAIVGGIQLAQKHPQERLDPPYDVVQSGASDMMDLVNDILIHTEIQSGKLGAKAESLSIRSLLDGVMLSFREFSDKRGLDVRSVVDSTVPAWVAADKEKLTVIISKLVNNAIKFTEQGGVTLEVTCDKSQSPWLLSCIVKDTGIGVAVESHEKIFDPFFQMEGGFKRRHGGMGIGLSICRRLAEAVGGTLTLASDLGKGSSFVLSLPVVAGVAPEEHKPKSTVSAELPLLVVEDNIVNQKVIVKMLKKLGYQALVANHGEEALAILEQEKVALILMDLQMPVMDGFSCTSAIRSRTDQLQAIPIIAVTANLMDVDKTRCTDSGMNDFMEKPVNLKKLGDCLSRYITAPV